MKKKLLVIGSGTGGVLTTGQMLEGLDSSWEVHNVYDPKIPILGVGEATSTLTPNALFKVFWKPTTIYYIIIGFDFIIYFYFNCTFCIFKITYRTF